MAANFGKKLLGVLLIVAIAATVLFVYNKYAESVGNPTWQQALHNASVVASQNQELRTQNNALNQTVKDLQDKNNFLNSEYPGIKNGYVYTALAILVFLFLLAYSLQSKKNDINMSIEQFRKIAVLYAYQTFSILPSSGYAFLQEYLPDHLQGMTRHPEHLTCTRYYEDTAVIEGKLNTKYFLGCFTQGTAYGFKTTVKEMTITIAICSNDPNDIAGYPAMSPSEVTKLLREKVKARQGIVNAGNNELLATVGQKAIEHYAAKTAEEEVA